MPDDLSLIHKAITRWNVLLGEQFAYVVVPVTWSADATAEFGEPPQDILNRQLVDVVDLGLAIFWSRLGTKTENAESGTAEEITRLHEAGKPVSVLRCNRPIPPRGDHAERARLEAYLQDMYGKALVVGYESDVELASQVDTILSRIVTQYEGEWASGTSEHSVQRSRSYVLPSIRTERTTEQDQKGRTKSKGRSRLVMRNEGGTYARQIRWRIEGADERLPWINTSGPENNKGEIPVLAGRGGEVTYPVIESMGDATEFLCIVEWDENGTERKLETTLRV